MIINMRAGTKSGGTDWIFQSKSTTPNGKAYIVEPDDGYDGLSSVVVYGSTNLVSKNIKSGVTIFKVTGSY